LSSASSRQIRLLTEPVISGIAAGEVAERPASIVKELVENALDAGATRIGVEYDDEAGAGGADDAAHGHRIAVTDDGHGIDADQLELAVTAHATSKLRALDDLERVTSFGFRGEALASIAAVSDLDLVSRTAGRDAGARIRVNAGKVLEVSSAGARPGTRIVVSDLFGSVPARRKFLKSVSAEYGQAADALKRFALAHPRLHLRLQRNGKVVFDHAAVADLPARLRQVYGREVGAAMVAVDARHAGLRLGGAISPAGVSFGSARRMSMFVNGRWVHDRTLFRAVMEAYRTYLLKGRYPAVALFMTIDPALVDVNVHPAKTEVRLSEPDLVQRFVIESIRDTLRGEASPLGRWGLVERDLLPTGADRGRARAGDGVDVRATVPASAATEGVRTPAGASVGQAPSAQVGPGGAGEALPGYTPGPLLATDRVEEAPTLPELGDAVALDVEVIGQVFNGYIVCQRSGELLLVDQHAAHERVLFERLMAAYADGDVASQPLLVADTVTVGGDGVAAVERHGERLARLGWELEPFGDEDVAVRAVPAIAAGGDTPALVERLVADLVRTDPGSAAARVAEQVMASVACHSAVRVGKRLERDAQLALLREVRGADFGAACPHGRPVAHSMTRAQLERLFGR